MKIQFLAPAIFLFAISCQNASKSDATNTDIKSEVSENMVAKKDSLPVITDEGGDMENGFVTKQSFKNKDLIWAYQGFVKGNSDDAKYLEPKVPAADTTVKKEDCEVIYKWDTKKKLNITLSFSGGETTIVFNDNGTDTEVETTKSPD